MKPRESRDENHLTSEEHRIGHVVRCAVQRLVILTSASRAAGGFLRETTFATNGGAENGARFNPELACALVIHRTKFACCSDFFFR